VVELVGVFELIPIPQLLNPDYLHQLLVVVNYGGVAALVFDFEVSSLVLGCASNNLDILLFPSQST
jgi:hypothetical protein